jgi:hypothetical protein
MISEQNFTVASFDIGKNNFAFCVEQIPIYSFVTTDNTDTVGKIVSVSNIKLGENKKKYTFSNLFGILVKQMRLWETCTVFLIEQQYTKNKVATKIQHHLEAFLHTTFPFRPIFIISAKLKTNKLSGGNYNMTYKQRKQFCIDQAIQILLNRNDSLTLKELEKYKKKDDICDAICQLSSWKKNIMF